MRSSIRVLAGLAGVFMLASCAAGPVAVPRAAETSAAAPPPTPPAAPAASPSPGWQARALVPVANVPRGAPFDGAEDYNTDLAFTGDHVIVGNYQGFTIYDISDPERPATVSRVICPGAQNDVSVSGDLLFLSVEERRAGPACDSGEAEDPSGGEGFAGIRIFDISDKAHPRYLAAVETPCGSHTHTLVPAKRGGDLYIYVSGLSYGIPDIPCPERNDKIWIIRVPVSDPAKARVVAAPSLLTGAEGSGCHDITVYPAKNLAAGACIGEGFLMDVSDPERPRVLDRVTDGNFQVWHSATFSRDGSKVVFSDELGGGLQATCTERIGPRRGANGIYEITADRRLVLRGYFKIPRHQEDDENCVAHNGSLIPAESRDLMVQGWYQGGVSVWDFTDPAHPMELAYFDRGPLEGGADVMGGSWSAYYYNGYIYSSEMTRGLDVLKLDELFSEGADRIRLDELNVQTQPAYR